MDRSTRHALVLSEAAIRRLWEIRCATYAELEVEELYTQALQAVRHELAHEQRPGWLTRAKVRATKALADAAHGSGPRAW